VAADLRGGGTGTGDVGARALAEGGPGHRQEGVRLRGTGPTAVAADLRGGGTGTGGVAARALAEGEGVGAEGE